MNTWFEDWLAQKKENERAEAAWAEYEEELVEQGIDIPFNPGTWVGAGGEPLFYNDEYGNQVPAGEYHASINEAAGENQWEKLWNEYMAGYNTGAPQEGETYFRGYTDSGDASALRGQRKYNYQDETYRNIYNTRDVSGHIKASKEASNPFDSKFFRGGRGGYGGTDISTSTATSPWGSEQAYNEKFGKTGDGTEYLNNLINSAQNSEWSSMGYETPQWIQNLLQKDEDPLVKPIQDPYNLEIDDSWNP